MLTVQALLQAPKVAAMMMLGFAAVVGVAVLSSHVGTRAELAEEQLHARGFSVADAILKADGVHDKTTAIPSSIAALAAQAAQEKETGQLSATVELPQIPKKIAAMAAEAKHEILIEQKVDKKKAAKKAAMTAAKAAASKAKLEQKKAAEKAATGKTEQTTKADIKKVQAAASLAKKHAVKHALKQGKVEGSNKLFHEVSKWAQGKGKKAKAAKK
ncbi:MAG: hypothetical protein ACPIOQ_68015 [Promethearchaeia archaeon]